LSQGAIYNLMKHYKITFTPGSFIISLNLSI
jgi:hypothetical protein